MRATCLVLALVLSPVSLVRAVSGADAARADHDEPAAHVDRFTPQGSVKQVRQASARFSVPMVALGDPRLSAPFDVDCPETGSGRWVDTRTWAYDFIRELPAGITCRFTLRPGLVTVGGAPVTVDTFTFSTGGPAIVRVMPDPSGPIAEDQVFVLSLDGTAEPASIVEHAGFTVQGLPERVPLQVVEGAEREAVVRTLDDWQREEPFVVVAARRRFPNGAAVELVWGPGIQSAGGVAGETPQTFRWTVRPVFTAELTCDRESANRGCIPLTPVVLHFTAPVAWSLASRAALVGPDGHRWTPRPARERGLDDRSDVRAAVPAGRDRARRAPLRRGRRRGPHARERRQLPARRPHRRRAAAREVRLPVRHHRVEGRPDAARHGAQPGAGRRGPSAPGGRARRTHPGRRCARLAAPRRRLAADALGLRRHQAAGAGASDQAAARGGRQGRGGDRHPARRARALRRRAGEHAARRGTARSAAPDVRADRGAGHQSLGASQVGS